MPTPTNKCILAPQYYGSVYYYAALAACSHAVIDTGLRYDKRFKSVHRTEIVDTRGPLRLTVPLSHVAPQADDAGCAGRLWSEMHVSSHGRWWDDHRVSLESAYGRTPYFEFYIDSFMPWLRDTHMPVTHFDTEIDATLRRLLGITAEVAYSLDSVDAGGYTDCRRNTFPPMVDVPYYQVRADRLGFVPGLSVLDLLFNMGPEAPLVLHRMVSGA